MNDFDPSYGYNLEQLLQINPPIAPDGFSDFWKSRYQQAIKINPQPILVPSEIQHPEFNCFDLSYSSTDQFTIGGWLLTPKQEPIKRGIIIGHGYGGRDFPDFNFPCTHSALLFPCFRGLSRSKRWPISDDPFYHVLHDIDKRDCYILGGCVEDLWLAVSSLHLLFPETLAHTAYAGESFGGGIGAMALPWDSRIKRCYLNVPSFGNNPIRMQLPTWGSAASVQNFLKCHGHIFETLSFYDAATAARQIQIPMLVAAALTDPVVAPPGQFSIYNALPGNKQLFVLDSGHCDYPRKYEQTHELNCQLHEFFKSL